MNKIVSHSHCIVMDMDAIGQNTNITNDDDDIYAARSTEIKDNEQRIFCRMHENCACHKPDDKYPHRSELVRFELKLDCNCNTIQHHQYLLIHATTCGIGTTSYEDIFSKFRSTTTMETHFMPRHRRNAMPNA